MKVNLSEVIAFKACASAIQNMGVPVQIRTLLRMVVPCLA